MSREELAGLLLSVNEKLGQVKSEALVSMNVHGTPDAVYVSAVYHTSYARGTTVETFSWTKKGGRLTLHGFHIRLSGGVGKN